MDFKETYTEMLERRYIDQSLFRGLDYSIYNDVERLSNELKELSHNRENRIWEILEKMNDLMTYKTVLKLKISSAIVTDSSENENKYVQARAAILNKNKKRSWISVHLGPLSEFKLDGKGKLYKGQVEERGREKVILKALAKLKEGN